MHLRRCIHLLATAAGVVVVCVLAGDAIASGADPNVVKTLTQPDGATLQVKIWGDEFIHGYETLDGFAVVFDAKTNSWRYAERDVGGGLKPSPDVANKDKPRAPKHLRPTREAINAARAAEGAPAIGVPSLATAPPWAGSDTDLLFIVAEFTDLGCTFTPAQMQTNMFGGGASGPGDLDAFFNEISYGDLQFAGTVVGDNGGTADCVNLANNRNFYNNNSTNADGDDDLVREAIADIDANVNFADYDNDNDGTVDALGIIYAGGGPHDGCATGTNSDNLWPHSGGLDTTATADGKTIRPFIITSEVTYALTNPSLCNQMQTIGLFAHELGHSLGLPDLYDTDVGFGGVHTWSTMASQFLGTTNNADTPPHYDPWSKAFLDWITPVVHQPTDRFIESISRVEDSGEVHQFRNNPNGFEIGGSGEYFLVENRQQVLFDAQIAGCGILVWHIDEAQTGNQNGGHTAASHRLVDIDEADGLAELDANGAADAGDPFPGSTNNTLFGDTTNPSSDLYDGSSSGVRMRVLTTSCASGMSAAFGPNQAPVADAGGPYETNEGTDVSLTAAGSTDPDGDALTYAWDLDNDGQFDDSTSQTPTFSLVGDNGVRTVRVQVTDAFGDSSTDSATVTINNVAPTIVGLANNGPTVELASMQVTGMVVDAGWLDSLTASIDWGDATGPQPLPGTLENNRPDATLTFAASHVYGDDGSFIVTVCAADDDGGAALCQQTTVTITNVNPTATIDETGTVSINGVQTFVVHAGQTIPFSARSTDPGSDDLTLTWDWGDDAPVPDVSTLYLNDPAFNPDPDPSPTINPRDVTDPRPHAFGDACFYTVTFGAADDDAGTASDTVKVIVAGNASLQRGAGYWLTQYRPRPTAFTEAQRQCYLAIVGFMSTVFDEVRNASTVQDAFDVLDVKQNEGAAFNQLDRQLLATWLNFANGAFDLTELVDTDGNGTNDTAFATVMATAEAVRIGPSTDAQKYAQRDILQRINGG